jgi:hypothetical protein
MGSSGSVHRTRHCVKSSHLLNATSLCEIPKLGTGYSASAGSFCLEPKTDRKLKTSGHST